MTLLTIGFAHHMDFYGAWAMTDHMLSILSKDLRMQTEFLAIDNSPNSSHGADLKGYFEQLHNACASAKYIPFDEQHGTTQPREQVFRLGTGKYRFCFDCHIGVDVNAMEKTIDWLESHPECNDLIQGPVLASNRDVYATHFQDIWNDEMWGIWGKDDRGLNPDSPPFEIGAMGLGLFGCRADAWPGFNPHFRGFGGEEWYIHEKFRQAGKKCLCLPWLRWSHRFARPDGIGYTLTIDHKVRNYILGHQELGLSLHRPYEHFVKSGKYPDAKWKQILVDPIANVPAMVGPPATIRRQNEAPRINVMAQKQDNTPVVGLSDLFYYHKNKERDLNKHAEHLRVLANAHKSIIGFVKRCEWNIFLAAGRPKKMKIYQREASDVLNSTFRAVVDHNQSAPKDQFMDYSVVLGGTADSRDVDSLSVEPEECELLILDTIHSADQLRAELAIHAPKVSKRILIRSTGAFGLRAESPPSPPNSDGPFIALREFLEQHEEWYVWFHTNEQYGYTIISRVPGEEPTQPYMLWPLEYGPGTELKKILSSVGINASANCGCNVMVQNMDNMGPQKCYENLDTIVAEMKQKQDQWGWKDKWNAAIAMAWKDPLLAVTINPLDPIPCLVRAAIQRAEKNEKVCSKANCKRGTCDKKSCKKNGGAI